MATSSHTIDRLEPWKDDGNIVLAAEGRYFRVHRSVLSTYSEVFKDMFACCHSAEAEADLVDLCPVIHLQDAATDVQIVLRALYDRSYPSPRCDLATVTAFLRLGEKYNIPVLLHEGKAKLSHPIDPTALSSISITIPDLFPAVLLGDSDPHYFQLLNLLQEKGLKTLLPLATYQSIVGCSLTDVLDGYEHKGSFYSLSSANLRSFMRMKDVLERYRLQLAKAVAASVRCRYCWSNANRLTDVVSPIDPWPLLWNSMFCPCCRSAIKRMREVEIKKAWDQIPPVFGFTSWEEVQTSSNSFGAECMYG